MKPTEPKPHDGPLQLFRIMQRVFRVLNGNVGFGDGTNTDNLDVEFITAVFTLANTDLTVNHTLGRIPVGYFPFSKAAACDVYTGSVAATATQITLRGTVATTVKLIIF